MARNHEIPDRWHPSQSSDSGSQDQLLSRSLQPLASALGTSVGSKDSDAPLTLKSEFNPSPQDGLPQKSPWLWNNDSRLDRGSRKDKHRSGKPHWAIRLLQRWELWGLITLAVSGGLGTTSLMMLLKLPDTPTCNYYFFWLKPAAGEQLYCAGQLASQNTTNGLLEAIAIAHELPPDHALRNQIDRRLSETPVH